MGGLGQGTGWRWWWWWCWWLGVACLARGVRGQQQCPETNVAVVVVASVFGTLAVVILVFGLVAFLVWRRRRALLGAPKKTHKALVEEGGQSPGREGHVNPAFSDGTGTLASMEEGHSNYVPCQDGPSPKHKKSPGDNSSKTWTSLPMSNMPAALQRQGSCGSLDNNYLAGDAEETSVWLQSQDFIGLGFNISGSMRDGMYVSHVHNRGPAIESNRVKVGDRIRSVTISFDHIVYEDALTILSYASPYPVKLSLQKERIVPSDPRLSESSDHLNHPLYRSQSMDALQRISKEPSYKPKRHFSEMKTEGKGKGKGVIQKLFNSDHQKDRQDCVFQDDADAADRKQRRKSSSPGSGPKMVMTDLTVHAQARETAASPPHEGAGKTGASRAAKGEKRLAVDAGEGAGSGGSESDKENQEPCQPGTSAAMGDPTALEFTVLTGKVQDLRDAAQTEAGASRAEVQAVRTKVVEAEIVASTPERGVSAPPAEKSPPPFKPQRKKKKSSTASTSSTDSRSSAQDSGQDGFPVSPTHVVLEDAIVPTFAKVDQTVPSAADHSLSEVQEEEIVPSEAKRDKVFDSNEIKFEEVDFREPSHPHSPLEDVAFEFVDRKDFDLPEGALVDEDVIEAVVAERKVESTPLPRGTAPKKPGPDDFQEVKLSNDLDDETLEQIIAMNSRPIELPQGLSGKNTREKQGGLSYDITVADLHLAETQLRSEVQTNAARRAPKGGLAFEIRDDVVSGRPVSVELNPRQVKRAKSCEASLEELWDKEKNPVFRSESFKGEEEGEDGHAVGLGWSGKRLVRSGSFSNIPQDDLVQDWTDPNMEEDGGEEEFSHRSSDDYIGSDSDTDQRKMTRADNIFAARENLANLSDLTDSNPSTGKSSPVPMATNGQDDGLGTSPELSPLKSSLNILPVAARGEESGGERPGARRQAGQTLSVSLNAGYNSEDDDADC